ncbi:hypothetical protein PENNAL_c0032G11787 [Penicillium nalgiovense]|uniref:Uncharacterized protein n=1 Tax=Penicillium nalgiovense TaxID=60175 RepID=A0A1V6Y7V8_PENNA|nr:hypothetical protein PENNAL_c0032G11787 [Penicillium nalgiovense]
MFPLRGGSYEELLQLTETKMALALTVVPAGLTVSSGCHRAGATTEDHAASIAQPLHGKNVHRATHPYHHLLGNYQGQHNDEEKTEPQN